MLKYLHNSAIGLLILRFTLGVLMLFHGVAKIMNPGSLDFIGGALSSFGFPSFMAYGVFIGEVIAPLMVIAGIHCRYGALLMVANMIVAILLVHSGDLFLITDHGGWRLELQGFYLFTALAIAFMGSGKYALKAD